MAKSAGRGEGVDPLQIRLNPRIHRLISERTKAHGTTMKAEIEELISKGEQLEKLMHPKGRFALDVLISLLKDDLAAAARKLLESGMGIGRMQSVIEKYKIDAGIVPMPKFPEINAEPEGDSQ